MKKLSEAAIQEERKKKSSVRSEKDLIGLPSRVFQAAELFGGEAEIGIVHESAMYRLRITRSGKLILTK